MRLVFSGFFLPLVLIGFGRVLPAEQVSTSAHERSLLGKVLLGKSYRYGRNVSTCRIGTSLWKSSAARN